MKFTVERIDLADTGSPEGLVTAILKVEPEWPIPTPIENLCIQLDIIEIQPLNTAGFEGGLLTQELKTNGIILVKNGVPRKRRRFTIAHELGHFLIPSHVPSKDGRFLCSRRDMLQQSQKEQSRRAKMEAEANRFASLILMPPPFLRSVLEEKHYPCLSTVIEIHHKFDVSKEAAARAFAEHNPESVAVLIAKDGHFLRAYRNRKFPWIALKKGDVIPKVSRVHSYSNRQAPSTTDETPAEHWIETQWGVPIPRMYEQVILQSKGFAIIQLKTLDCGDREEFDPEDNLTSKERFQRRQENWRQ